MKATDAINILMVTARYYPYMGGIETHVHEVSRRLAHAGVGVTLLTTVPGDLPTPLPREEVVEGVRILRVSSWPRQRDYYFAPEMRSLIKGTRWDLVHCQGCHTFVPPLAMLAAREARIPYLLTFHTGGHSSQWRNNIRGLQWRIQRPLLASAAALVGVSQFEARYFRDLLHLPVEKFVVISNGATLPGVPDQQEFEPGLILSVGRLERYKGHQHAIAALPKLREWCPEAHLLILGTGPYEAALCALAQEYGVEEHVEIRAIPAHDRQEMASLLSRAALVTLLSEYEAHPVAVMEALALRRPVLVFETSGLKELADQELVKGIPLASGPTEVALAMRRQIEDPVLPPASFVPPSWDDCASQLQAVYRTVIENRR